MRLIFFARAERDKALEELRLDLIYLLPQDGFVSIHGNKLEAEDIAEWIEDIAIHGTSEDCIEALNELEDSLKPNTPIAQIVRRMKIFYRSVCRKSKHVADMEHAGCENAKARKRGRKPRFPDYVHYPEEKLELMNPAMHL